MAFISNVYAQQSDEGGKPTITTTVKDNKVISNMSPTDFSSYYDKIVDVFGEGSIKTLEFNGTKYSVLGVNNKTQMNISSGNGFNPYGSRYNSRSGRYASKIPVGYSIPNCTAWAFARILELMLVTGNCFIVGSSKFPQIDGKKLIISYNNVPEGATIENSQYGITFLSTILDCGDGRQFFDNWPGRLNKKFGEELGWAVSDTPKPGSVVAWKLKTGGSGWNVRSDYNGSGGGYQYGFPGHVAVVEKVIDPGLDTERILVSESNYSGGGTAWDYLVKMYEIRKHNNYGTGDYGLYNLECLGFGYTPASMQANGGADQCVTVPIEQWSYTNPSIEKQRENGAIDPETGEVLYNIKQGGKVEIQWAGYSNRDGTGNPIHIAGRQGYVIKFHGEQYNYPYEIGDITEDGKITTWGFYKRIGLKKLN